MPVRQPDIGRIKSPVIEIDPVLLCLTRRYMPADSPGSGPQVKINTHIQDPRQYLRSDNAFDLIISGCAEPSTALANRFFTRTFFKWCEARLAPGGILGFRLNSSENFWSPALAYRNASVVAALGSVFRHVLVLPGSVNVVLASQSDLVTEPDILIARYRDRNLKTRLVSPPYLEYILSGDRLAEIDRILAAQAAPPNTDDRPVCYSLSTWIWLSRLMPGLAHQNVSEWIQAALRYGWIAVAIYHSCLRYRDEPAGRKRRFVGLCGRGFCRVWRNGTGERHDAPLSDTERGALPEYGDIVHGVYARHERGRCGDAEPDEPFQGPIRFPFH